MTADDTQNFAPGHPAADEAALLRLLVLAGPGDAPELMRRLISDLSDVAAGIGAGLATQDSQMMRKHSHVLMAIAGTIGAQPIYNLAKHLNDCAKDGNFAKAEPWAGDLTPRITGQIERLRALSVELGLVG